MNKYLLQPENGDLLRRVYIKYAMLMEVAEFTVTDLMELNGVGVQELMRFNPTNFYHDYIGSKDLLPAYAKLILNIGVLNRGILRDVAGSVATAANTLGEAELKQKLMDLNTQYDPRTPVEKPVNQFERALQNVPTAPKLEEQWGIDEVSDQFKVGTIAPVGSIDGPMPSIDNDWVKDIQPSMGSLSEDDNQKIR